MKESKVAMYKRLERELEELIANGGDEDRECELEEELKALRYDMDSRIW